MAPNILFIMADQMAAPILPFYDSESVVKMPHLSKMARDSVLFDNAYCNAPLCAPSRFSMVTGQLPHRIGAYDNASELPAQIPTFAHYLRSLGYHTALSGKMHFVGPDQLHGYEERLTPDIYPGDYGWSVNWDKADLRLDWFHNMASVTDAGVCVRSNQIDYDEEVMYRAKNYLYDHVRRNKDQPFFLTVALTHPHDPYTTRKEWWDLYENVEIPLPKSEPAQHELDPHSIRLQKVIDLHDKPVTDEQKKAARRAYFGNCSYIDHNVGVLRQVLGECDLSENTIVIFSGDHGDMLGEHSLWYKMNFREMSARIPLMVYAPSYFTPRRVKEATSSMDFLPTLVDLASGGRAAEIISPDLPMDGRSLYPYLQGKSGPDVVYAEYMGEGTISPMFMIRQGRWKFVSCPTDPPQLFNLEDDPLEMVNLAETDANHKALVATFQQNIDTRCSISQIHQDVLKSQRQRRLCWEALSRGRVTAWDHQPLVDSSRQYIRNHGAGILDDLEAVARYPAVRSATAQPPAVNLVARVAVTNPQIPIASNAQDFQTIFPLMAAFAQTSIHTQATGRSGNAQISIDELSLWKGPTQRRNSKVF